MGCLSLLLHPHAPLHATLFPFFSFFTFFPFCTFFPPFPGHFERLHSSLCLLTLISALSCSPRFREAQYFRQPSNPIIVLLS